MRHTRKKEESYAPGEYHNERSAPQPRASWLMTAGFLVYTCLILAGHIAGFPLAYAYLHTVCPDGCGLTPENVHALKRYGLSIAFYANLYMAIQVLYILVSVGVALLIVFKKPGEWVPLGVGCFLVGFSAYEGADYPALIATYPVLDVPLNGLLSLGMGVLGMYALLTFPDGKFGSRWVLGYYLLTIIEGVFALFITPPLCRVEQSIHHHQLSHYSGHLDLPVSPSLDGP